MYDETVVDPAKLGMNKARLDAIPEYFQTRYIDQNKFHCAATLVARGGEIVHEAYRGATELGGGDPIGPDTIFRIYSMTKPITSVAAMMLLEEGDLRLDHEVSRFIPEFADVEVWESGSENNFKTRKPDRPILVRDALTHTSGVTYPFLFQHEVDAAYRSQQIGLRADETLEEMCRRLASMPLLFSPGTCWNYGYSTDIVARIIEVVSGEKFDDFLRKRIFEPLGMVDTDFYVPQDKAHRLIKAYLKNPFTGEVTDGVIPGVEEHDFTTQPTLLNGGGGLVSTLRDYYRFCQCLLNGGSLGDVRLLSPKTVEFMRMNHLPDNKTIKDMGDKSFSEARMEGNGFCLCGSVTTNVVETMTPGSVGSYGWGGLANTFFWIDPEEDLLAIKMLQIMPTGCYPVRPQMQYLVYSAIDS
ncbi:MAG: serine hydrolase domain-containing protein [Pseudomonadota bacterium]